MKNVAKIFLVLSFAVAQMGYAQEEEKPFSEAQAMLQEATQAQQQDESLSEESAYNDNLSPQQRFEESPKHNVHEYNYKQQAIVGGAVMFCVTLAFVMNNNYNPKRGN